MRKSETIEQKANRAARLKRRREIAKANGAVLSSDTWFQRNKEKHRERVARWRAANADKAKQISRQNQADRRSTPWGAINNRIWSVMHGCVRSNSSRRSKYTDALGYHWSDLRSHIEGQFSLDMSWDNWGKVWELDHIVPVVRFKYVSLDDPLFRQAWALNNLRPLHKNINASKGCKLEGESE